MSNITSLSSLMLEGIFICFNVTAWFVQSLKFFSILQEPEAKENKVSCY